MSSSSEPCYFGIDVGTGSARAILVTASGEALATHSQATKTWRSPEDSRIFQQSTGDIWAAIATCVKKCLEVSKVDPARVKGLGFDATCSLAVVDGKGEPVDVSPPQHGQQWGSSSLKSSQDSFVPNIVLWADHRAEEEARTINATGHKVLDYVGGSMSLEMVRSRDREAWLALLTARTTAGDPQDALAQEEHARQGLSRLPIL